DKPSYVIVVRSRVLVDLRENDIIGRLAWLELNLPLHNRLGLGRIVQLLRAVRRHEVFQGAPSEQLILRVVGRRQLFRRQLIVLYRLLKEVVVVLFSPLARLEQVVIAVPEEEIRFMGYLRVGRSFNGLLVKLRRLFEILLLIRLVGGLERLASLNLADLGASDRRGE